MEEKKGIVKSISTKRQGFYAFTLRDVKDEQDKDIWFSGKGQPEFNKGDEIKFSFVETINGQYVNRNIVNLEVLKKENSSSGQQNSDFRSNVDAGNAVSFAKDIACAEISKGNGYDLTELSKQCAKAFIEAKKIIEGKDSSSSDVLEKQKEVDLSEYPNY